MLFLTCKKLFYITGQSASYSPEKIAKMYINMPLYYCIRVCYIIFAACNAADRENTV